LAPGEALPSERRLCDLLKVNRGAVREGLKRLHQAGLVQIHQGEPTRVLDYRDTGSFDLLAHLLLRSDGTPNLQVARSLVEMRGALAPEMARLFAERASADDVAALDALVDDLAATDDLDARQLLAIRFWGLLARGSGNIAYQLAFNTLSRTYTAIRHLLLGVLAGELEDVASHRAIARAAKQRDGTGAARRARNLLAKGSSGMLELFDQLEEETP
jgi:DNA-binding FadR family transcriptional regulator